MSINPEAFLFDDQMPPLPKNPYARLQAVA